LDTQLYTDCKDDAKKICRAKDWGEDKESTMPDNFVISCLYRNALFHDNPEHKVNEFPFLAIKKCRIMYIKIRLN